MITNVCRDRIRLSFFCLISWVYSKTNDDAAAIAGGGASSAGFDAFYLGWRRGDLEKGQIELAAGRYPYQIAHGFIVADGYARSAGGSFMCVGKLIHVNPSCDCPA